MAWDVRLDAGDATDSTVVLRNGIGSAPASALTTVKVYSSSGNSTVVLHGPSEAPETADQPYQTGVRSRRPATGVVFRRAPLVSSAVTAARAAGFVLATLVASRAAHARPPAHVTFLRNPAPPPTSVTFDASSSSQGNGTNTVTWSHTTSGANRYLVVMAGSYFADGEVTGVTYNGTALTLLGRQTPTDPRHSFWGMPAPATGANNIVVTFAGPASGFSGLVAISFNGVDQFISTGTFATATGVSNAPSVTSPNTDVNGLIAAFASDYAGNAITIGTGILRESPWSFAQGATQYGWSPTTSWTIATSDTWTASAILLLPVSGAAPVPRPSPSLVLSVAGEAREARARTTDFVSSAVYLRSPARDGNTRTRNSQITVGTLTPERAPRRPRARVLSVRNPQAPVAVPPAKAMPFTIVSQYAVQRARLTARPTGEVAQTAPASVRPVPYVVSLVGKRIARPRATGAVIFRRELPANFDADGSIPITTVVQQSRAFFRRPTSRVSFVRTPQAQAGAPAAKAMPTTVASLVAERSTVRPRGSVVFVRTAQPFVAVKAMPPTLVETVAGEAREARARTTDFVSSVLYVRNPAKDGNTRPQLGQITVATLTPERAARRPVASHILFERNFVPYAKGTQPVVGTLIPERAPRRPKTGVFFTRNAGGFTLYAKGTQPTIGTLVPERAARRPKTKSQFVRRQILQISGASFPCYVVVLTPRPTVDVLGARPPVVTLTPRPVTVVLSARPTTVTLLSRQTSFNINAMR